MINSCKKEEEEKKEPMSCIITNPQDGQEFHKDQDIQVIVTVKNSDEKIASIHLYINGIHYIGTSEVFDFSCHFTITVGDIAPGSHTLKVIATNSAGEQAEALITITIKNTLSESPDFVSFSDGKMPIGWEVTGWQIVPSDGYDDMYSLYVKGQNATATTTKTCDYVEFYLKGYGRVNLYVDGSLWEEIDIGTWSPAGNMPQGWKLYSYSLPEGFHSFSWEYTNRTWWANLDAISFVKESE